MTTSADADAVASCRAILSDAAVVSCMERAGIDLKNSPLAQSHSSVKELSSWLQSELQLKTQRAAMVDKLLSKAGDDPERSHKLLERQRGLRDGCDVLDTLLASLFASHTQSANDHGKGVLEQNTAAQHDDQPSRAHLSRPSIDSSTSNNSSDRDLPSHHFSRELAASQAEVIMIRNMLKHHNLDANQRLVHEQRASELEASVAMYKQMLASAKNEAAMHERNALVPELNSQPANISALVEEAALIEAAKEMVVKKAADEAELLMARKLLARQNGRKNKAQQQQLQQHLIVEEPKVEASNQGEDLLRSMLIEENKRAARVGDVLHSADEEFKMKLAKGRGRRGKKGAESSLQPNNVVVEGSSDPTAVSVTSLAMHHLGLDETSAALMSTAEVQAELRRKNIDVDLGGVVNAFEHNEASKAVEKKRAADQAELDLLRKLMKKRGQRMSSEEKSAIEAQEAKLQAAVTAGDELLSRLQQEETARGRAQTGAEMDAQRMLQEKLKRGRKSRVSTKPLAIRANSALISALLTSIAECLSLEPSISIDELKLKLQLSGATLDMDALLQAPSDSVAIRALSAQRGSHERELLHTRSMLQAQLFNEAVALSELRAQEGSALDALNLLDAVLHVLCDEQRKRWDALSDEERTLNETLSEKLTRGRWRRSPPSASVDSMVSSDLIMDVNQLVNENALVGHVMGDLARQHLEVTSEQLAVMTVAQVEEQLSHKGVEIDMGALLAGLAQSEAAKAMSAKRAADQSELDFVRKLLRKQAKKLNQADREHLEARQRALQDSMAKSDAMLAEVVREQTKQAAARAGEEDAAQRQFLEKLSKKKQRASAAAPESVPESATVSDDLSQRVGDHAAVSAAISRLAAQFLQIDTVSLQTMSVEQVQAELNKHDVKLDMQQLLRDVADSEAAKALSVKRANDQADLDFIHKLIRKQGKKLGTTELKQLEDRERALEDAIEARDELLQLAQTEASKRAAKKLGAEEMAQQRLFEKLQRGKSGRSHAHALSGGQIAKNVSILANEQLLTSVMHNVAAHLEMDVDVVSGMSVGEIESNLQKKGVDVNIGEMLRSASDQEAAQLLASKRAQDEAELRLIRKLLARKAIGELERNELLLKEKALQSSLDLADSLLDSVLDDERKRWSSMTDQQQQASDTMREKLSQGRRKKKGQADVAPSVDANQLVADHPLLGQLIASLVHDNALELTSGSMATMSVAAVQAELEKKGLKDIDLLEMLRSLNSNEAAQQLAAKRAADEAELGFIRKLMQKSAKNLNATELHELEVREKSLQASLQASDGMMMQLLEEERARQAAQLEEERKAEQRLMQKLLRAKQKKKKNDPAEEGRSFQDNMALKAQLLATVADHLEVDAGTLASMPTDQLQAELHKRGIHIDLEAMMRSATDSEAARALAAKRAQDEAQLRMIRKMLAKQGLAVDERQKLLAQELELENSLALSDALLATLLSEEQKRWAMLSEEERLANERMREKLARGRHAKVAITVCDASDASGAEQLHAPFALSSSVGDSTLLMSAMAPIAMQMLGLSNEAVADMTVEQLQAELAKQGLDIDLMAMLKDLNDSEAGRLMAAKRAAAEAELDFIRKLLNNKQKKLSPAERAALLEREQQLKDEVDAYALLLARLADEERRRKGLMSAEEQRAYDQMMDKLRRGKKQKQAQQINTPAANFDFDPREQVIGAHAELLQVLLPLAHAHLDVDDAAIASMTVEELQEALRQQGCDIDIMEMLRDLANSEAARILAARRAAMQAEADLYRKMLMGKKKLTPQQRNDIEERIADLEFAIESYDELLNKLLELELRRLQHLKRERENADRDLNDRLMRGKRRQVGLEESASQVRSNPALLAQLLATVADHLEVDAGTLASMPTDQLQAELHKRGIHIDLEAMMRSATDSEAARALAAKRAQDEAQLRMIRKMLAKQGLAVDERQKLLAQELELENSLALSDALLATLLSEEQKRWAMLSEEERLANERMREKLARGRHAKVAITVCDASDASGAEQLHAPFALSSSVGDSTLLMSAMAPIAMQMLGLSNEAVADMTVEQLQAELAKQGLDIDLMAMLKDLNDSEAGRLMAAKRAAAEAELDFIRKLLNNKQKKLSPAERAALLEREQQLKDEVDAYALLLARLADEERRRKGLMSAEEQRAYDQMMDKLRRGKKQKQAQQINTPAANFDFDPREQVIGAHAELLQVLLPLAHAHLDVDDAAIASMTVEELQEALRQQGCDIDIMEMLRDLANSEAARILAARRAAMQAEADLYRKMLMGKKKLTPQQREDLERRVAHLDASIESYDALLQKLLELELRKIQHQKNEQERAETEMRDRLSKGKKRKANNADSSTTAVPKMDARRRAAARADAEQVFDSLVSSEIVRCSRCGRAHLPEKTSCLQCGCALSPGSLTAQQLTLYHRTLHHCSVSPALVHNVMTGIGPIVRESFIDALETLTTTCIEYERFATSLRSNGVEVASEVLTRAQAQCGNDSISLIHAQSRLTEAWT